MAAEEGEMKLACHTWKPFHSKSVASHFDGVYTIQMNLDSDMLFITVAHGATVDCWNGKYDFPDVVQLKKDCILAFSAPLQLAQEH